MMACVVCQFVICLVGTKSGNFSVIIPFVPEAPVTLCMKSNTIINSLLATLHPLSTKSVALYAIVFVFLPSAFQIIYNWARLI